jgi:hypothetical protein
VIESDDHVADDGESAVLTAALTHWGLPQVWLADRRSQPAAKAA